MKKLTVAVVYGGKSGEHDVSLQSAAAVMLALDRNKYSVIPVLIRKDGGWQRVDGNTSSPTHITMRGTIADDVSNAEEWLDVAFPLIHGTYGEDGSLQGLLEMAGVPYVGAGVLGSAIGMDKRVQKRLFSHAGIPVAPSADISASAWRKSRDLLLDRCERACGYPAFVKPAAMGSSVGVSKAKDRESLAAGIGDALRYDRHAIVERAVPDARELECGVIGADEPLCSAIGEIVPSNEFYDYAAKYLDGRSKMIIPAQIPAHLSVKITDFALRAFRQTDCHGLARIDFLYSASEEELFLNEINTLPGFTAASMFASLWHATGVPLPALLDRLIGYAMERAAHASGLVRSYAEPHKTRV